MGCTHFLNEGPGKGLQLQPNPISVPASGSWWAHPRTPPGAFAVTAAHVSLGVTPCRLDRRSLLGILWDLGMRLPPPPPPTHSGGSHGATTPFPGWSWGSKPGSGLKCILRWLRGNIGTHPWPAPWASPMGSDLTRGRQCGHTAQPGDPVEMVNPPPPPHTHTVGGRQVSRQFALCAGLIFDGAPGDHGSPGPMRVSLFNIVPPQKKHYTQGFAPIFVLTGGIPPQTSPPPTPSAPAV